MRRRRGNGRNSQTKGLYPDGTLESRNAPKKQNLSGKKTERMEISCALFSWLKTE